MQATVATTLRMSAYCRVFDHEAQVEQLENHKDMQNT
jgi:hypothetical protein